MSFRVPLQLLDSFVAHQLHLLFLINYIRLDTIYSWMEQLAARFPHLVSLKVSNVLILILWEISTGLIMQVIGTTSEGRNLVVVTVGNNRGSAWIISIIYISDKSDRYITYRSVCWQNGKYMLCFQTGNNKRPSIFIEGGIHARWFLFFGVGVSCWIILNWNWCASEPILDLIDDITS